MRIAGFDLAHAQAAGDLDQLVDHRLRWRRLPFAVGLEVSFLPTKNGRSARKGPVFDSRY